MMWRPVPGRRGVPANVAARHGARPDRRSRPLKKIYTASDADAAFTTLAAFADSPLGRKYPQAVKEAPTFRPRLASSPAIRRNPTSDSPPPDAAPARGSSAGSAGAPASSACPHVPVRLVRHGDPEPSGHVSGHGLSRGRRSGKVTRMLRPPPGLACAVTSPPWAWAIEETMESPRPVPSPRV